MPSELDQPLPRQVELNLLTKMAVVFMVMVIGFIVSLPFGISYFMDHRLDGLRKNGVSLLGNIVKFGSNRGSIYAEYKFSVDAGFGGELKYYAGSGLVTEKEYNEFQVGDLVPIVYDPNHVNEVRTYKSSFLNLHDRLHTDDPTEDRGAALKLCLKVALFSFSTTWLTMFGPMLKEYRLIRRGAVAKCSVKRMSRTKLPPFVWSAWYDFTTQDGSVVVDANCRTYSKDRPREIVIYNPANFGQNILYPPIFFQFVRPKKNP